MGKETNSLYIFFKQKIFLILISIQQIYVFNVKNLLHSNLSLAVSEKKRKIYVFEVMGPQI